MIKTTKEEIINLLDAMYDDLNAMPKNTTEEKARDTYTRLIMLNFRYYLEKNLLLPEKNEIETFIIQPCETLEEFYSSWGLSTDKEICKLVCSNSEYYRKLQGRLKPSKTKTWKDIENEYLLKAIKRIKLIFVKNIKIL